MTTEPRITISRIAAEAGVSVPTVSKVVNGHSDVADETRARVEELIRKYGYRRRADQRSQRSRLLELMFHEIESTWALEIIRGVENVARENGMSVVLAESSGRHTPAHDWVESVLTRRPVGIISVCSDLTDGQLAQLRSRDIPLVVIDPAGQPGPETPSVGTTNRQGGLAATRHLLDLGHRRIAMIGGPDGVLCGRARIDGYRAALEAAGQAFDPALVRRSDFHPGSGYRQLTSLLALPDRPTAVFAGSDLQALGVYEAARDAGLRIPHDLSVIGFDDLPLACWLTPELTTIRQPLRQMAAAGARLALSLARGRVLESHRIELATSLVVRDSTAPPAGHVPSRRLSGGPR